MLNKILWNALFVFTIQIHSHSQDLIFDSTFGGGTVLFAAKCENGIILATDSRFNVQASLSKDSSFQVAYLDNFQKIYIIDNYAVAMAGRGFADGKSIGTILSNFKNTKPAYTDPSSFVYLFARYLQEKHPVLFEKPHKSVILCCGYFQNKPQISILHKNVVGEVSNYYMMSDQDQSFVRQYKSTMECKRLKSVAINLIDSIPINDTTLRYSVGGKTNVLLLSTDNKFKWLTKQKKMLFFENTTQYFEYVLSGKSKIKYLKEEYREPLLDIYRGIISNPERK